ncbi:hypothetical protein [Pedobacter caeni]|uniref:Uncharacterized protein n=1 Tax=Pedobacter caeni TaxID=288992 RepID=A0A1M5ISA1_9SPHI|nr:hypothetical protein [Pedobacter caeni]SHG31141.1 hypothetical protein SAMN04488522_10543 [Pedobacter caeni]
MRTIYDIEYLQEVTTEIQDWDYGLVQGMGVFSTSERYAHIELKVYTRDHYTDQIIWNVKEEYIPADLSDFRDEIEEVLTFFGNYLYALKGRREKKLVYEVIDGSFCPDTCMRSFVRATARALVNCFNKERFKPSPADLNRIRNSQANGLELLKSFLTHASQEEVVASLKNVSLTVDFKALFTENELFLINENLYNSIEILKKKEISQEAYFKKHKLITKYGDISQIGMAHLVLILNRKDLLPQVGVFQDEEIAYKFLSC